MQSDNPGPGSGWRPKKRLLQGGSTAPSGVRKRAAAKRAPPKPPPPPKEEEELDEWGFPPVKEWDGVSERDEFEKRCFPRADGR